MNCDFPFKGAGVRRRAVTILFAGFLACLTASPPAAAEASATGTVPYWPSERETRLREIEARIRTLERAVLLTRAKADRARVLGRVDVERTHRTRLAALAAELNDRRTERRQLIEGRAGRDVPEPEARASFPTWDRRAEQEASHRSAEDGQARDVSLTPPSTLVPVREPGQRGRRGRPRRLLPEGARRSSGGAALAPFLPLAATVFLVLVFSPYARRDVRVHARHEGALRARELAAESTHRRVDAAAREAKTGERRARVLLVDDSPTTRECLAEIVRESGQFELLGTAVNGLDAVVTAMRTRPDVVVMDLEMPVMDGFEAAAAIMDSVPAPVVAVSGNLDVYSPEVASKAIGAGAVAVLPKPPDPDHPEHEQAVRLFIDTLRSLGHLKVKSRDRTEDLPRAA